MMLLRDNGGLFRESASFVVWSRRGGRGGHASLGSGRPEAATNGEARGAREEERPRELRLDALHRQITDGCVVGSVVRLGGLPVKYSYVALFCGKYFLYTTLD